MGLLVCILGAMPVFSDEMTVSLRGAYMDLQDAQTALVYREDARAGSLLYQAERVMSLYPYDLWVNSAAAYARQAYQTLVQVGVPEWERRHRVTQAIRQSIDALIRSRSYADETRGVPPSRPSRIVGCSSALGSMTRCWIPGRVASARVWQQRSIQPCLWNSTWGISLDRRSLWVDRGCSADFLVFLTGG